jgi:hypothetical protein
LQNSPAMRRKVRVLSKPNGDTSGFCFFVGAMSDQCFPS